MEQYREILPSSLRIIFAGTPAFAVPSLEALIQAGYSIIAVFTQPDRPSGRGQRLTMSPIKILAGQQHIPVYQPERLKDPEAQRHFLELEADLIVVVAYGLLLPEKILRGVRYGAINVHPSLLPRWRGATPIQSAILAGDPMTGVTVMQLTQAMDAGPILYQSASPIAPSETSADLHDRLAQSGAKALLITLNDLGRQDLHPLLQDEKTATYSRKIEKNDAKMIWEKPAAQLAREVRAYHPWPVAFTYYDGQLLRVWAAEPLKDKTSNYAPGVIENIAPNGLDIATGEGVLRLLTVQSPGGRPVSVAEFIRARQKKLTPGATQLG